MEAIYEVNQNIIQSSYYEDRIFASYWQVPNINLPAGTYYCTVETLHISTTQAFVIIK